MELIFAIIVLGAVQIVVSAPAIYNNELSKNSYFENSKFNPNSLDYKTSWSSVFKDPLPIKSYKQINEINKFPFDLKSKYNNDQQELNKENESEKKILIFFEYDYEDDSESTDDYDEILLGARFDKGFGIDDALMCSLLGRCFEDQ